VTTTPVPRIAVITGSTRPGRNGEAVARWVEALARNRDDAQFELVDIADYKLPLLDEPMPPRLRKYTKPHTQAWSEKIASFDGFVFVTPEYNHGMPAALKNALDFLFHEWSDKAAGFVSYGGGASGARAVEQLRGVAAELGIATVRPQLLLSMHSDFEGFKHFKPLPQRETELKVVLDHVISWARALKTVRVPQQAPEPRAAHAAA
jgi:NAD(P)H-dependent FMN reductase